MKAFISVEYPDGRGLRSELKQSASIGRAASNEFQISDDELVSRRHALIRLQGRSYVLIDLGSSNGSQINSRPVVTPTRLRDQDLIRIGNTNLRFEQPCNAEGRARGKDKTGLETETLMGVRTFLAVVLVCDLRGFTAISERIAPDSLARLLSQWFRSAAGVITASGGVVDRYIGDAVMAYWEFEIGKADWATRTCVNAAFELIALAEGFAPDDLPGTKIELGIGISGGVVSAGNMGGVSQRDSTIIGDTVNLAFRLEGLSKQRQIPIVVSTSVQETLRDGFDFMPLGPVSLKGKSSPQDVFGLTASGEEE